MLIYLTGYMGSGKSKYGRIAAQYLGYDFIDLDRLISKKTGLSIYDYFGKLGEASFRRLEQDTLFNTVPLNNTIISTGGGTPCFGSNMQFMKNHGLTIYIKLKPAALVSRLKRSLHKRPVLTSQANNLLQFVEEHLKEREKYYMRSDFVIEGEGLTGEKLAGFIKEIG